MTQHIGIIGAGASGIACFVQLIRKLHTKKPRSAVKITIWERKKEFGPGLAFGTGQEGHLLNTRAGIMSIIPEEPLHFVQWMHDHDAFIQDKFPQVTTHPDSYPPRMLYGEYTQAVFEDHLRLAESRGISVDRKQLEIEDLQVDPDGQITVISKNHQKTTLSRVILATGCPGPAVFSHLEEYPNFLASPWPSGNVLSTISDKASSVAIVGSSLTAIDAAITLTSNGHHGPITFFSIKGLLPRVQSPSEVPFERRFLTLAEARKIAHSEGKLTVKKLIRLFRKEVEACAGKKIDWSKDERVDKDHLSLMEYDIRKALDGKSIYQNILYSLRKDTYPIWQLLDADQKQLFGKWIKPYYDINRHAIPVENGIKVMNLLKSGQLSVIGHSDDIKWKEQHFELRTENGKCYEVDYVINASGPTMDIEKMDDIPLLPRLLEKGYISKYEGGGVKADLASLKVIAGHGDIEPEIYIIGHPLAGLQHDVNALWFNAEQADRLTDHLIKQFA